MASVDNWLHVSEEESQKQSTNMTTVHVGIGHNNYSVITQAIHTKLFFNPDTQRFNQSYNLVVSQHLIKPSSFNVQHLTAKWQNSLSFAVTTTFGRTTSRIALHDVEF